MNIEKRKLVEIQSLIDNNLQLLKGSLNDGYHTFDELYHHRMILFSIILNLNKHRAWKSKHHHDGSMYNNYFIVGIDTDEGQFTYHYHLDNWHYFKNIKELDFAPEYDGHQPKDITRLLSLINNKKERKTDYGFSRRI